MASLSIEKPASGGADGGSNLRADFNSQGGPHFRADYQLDESIRSLTDRSGKARGWLRATPDQCERLQRALDAAKRNVLAKVPSDRVLAIRYQDLLAAPASQVDRIIDFLGLAIRPEQCEAAIGLVAPTMKHF